MKYGHAYAILLALIITSTGIGWSKPGSIGEYKHTGINSNKTSPHLLVGKSEQVYGPGIPHLANQQSFEGSTVNTGVSWVINGFMKAAADGQGIMTATDKDFQNTMPEKVTTAAAEDKYALLFEKKLNYSNSIPELITNGVAQYTAEGLKVTGKNKIVRLNKFYVIAQRKVQYIVKFSADAKAIFRSSEGDFNAFVDIQKKSISIATNPVKEATVNFLHADREYLVELYHIYQKAIFRIVDIQTGEATEITAINDGQGGVGNGVLQPGFSVGMQWDHYCFGLTSGSSMLVKRINVYALKKKVKLLMFGDSITQPEGYFPTKDFPLAWTQQVIKKLKGDAMSSGRGGARIDMILDYIKNELPFIATKYVMVTIGTNGGNTEAKLFQLVDYVKSKGAILILNNIPCNESGTQVAENMLIDKVRKKAGLKGCRFDIATSIAGDGKNVNKSLMYWEDYTGTYGWQIYHHPNEKGGTKMFERTLIDVPELYQ